MFNKENDIIQMIGAYTDQIERYESMSTWFSAFCVVCIFTVLIFASVLIIRQKKEENTGKAVYDVFLSGMFLIIHNFFSFKSFLVNGLGRLS